MAVRKRLMIALGERPAYRVCMASLSTHSATARLVVMARDIKLAHSVFALPFAIFAACLASDTPRAYSRFAGQLALVIVCMVAARTWAMLVNRMADRHIDALNPRTESRAFASGTLSARFGYAMLFISSGLFVLGASGFGIAFGNWWPATLSVPVLGWIAAYSYTKRFTWMCHIMLGGALAASPLAAGIAVRPEYLLESPALWWLAGMVAFWVAGFDVIYALADLEFDRQAELNSIPARFGAGGAAWISRALHTIAMVALILAWRADKRLGVLTGMAIVIVGVLLVMEHVVLARRGERGLNMAFFTLNGIVSCVLGLAGSIDALS